MLFMTTIEEPKGLTPVGQAVGTAAPCPHQCPLGQTSPVLQFVLSSAQLVPLFSAHAVAFGEFQELPNEQ